MKEVTTALIGCGQRGPWHGQRTNSSRKLRLLAVCDLDESRARRTSELLGVDYVLDYKELLEREDLDSVIIATHTKHHGNIAIDAARAGKHILVEKPLVDSVETGKKLIRAADEEAVVGMVAYQLRFTELSSTLKKEAQSLEPLQALLTVQRGMMAPQYFFPEHYGGVIDTASHTIHRGLWLMEGKPKGVYATLRRGTFRGGDTIDFANMMIDFDGGRSVTIITSMGAPNTQNIIQVVGRKGSLTTNDMKTLEVMRHRGPLTKTFKASLPMMIMTR